MILKTLSAKTSIMEKKGTHKHKNKSYFRVNKTNMIKTKI